MEKIKASMGIQADKYSAFFYRILIKLFLKASLDSINGNETRSKNEVTDLKKEVMSLKGLLLSR